MWMDGRTDRHGEANSRFSQFCEGLEFKAELIQRVRTEMYEVAEKPACCFFSN